jgi:two-component system OmpR family sensor kinase
MVLAIAALAAVGLVAVDVAGTALLNSYLIRRVDEQLQRGAGRAALVPSGQSPERTRTPPSFGPDFRFYRFDSAGRLVDQAGTTASLDPSPGSPTELERRAAAGQPYTVDGSSASWRVLVTRPSTGQGYLVSAVSLREVQDTEARLALINAAVSAIVLVLMAIAAATVVRVGLRPLTRMEHTAAEIARGDLSRRVADADPHTESGRLGSALNMMLSRIEAAVADRADSERRLRQFLADAAHELRTPLTSIQGFAELYRRGGAPQGPALDEAMGRIEADVSRMRLLVNDLLVLARLDEERPLERAPVDLLAVAADAVRDAHLRVPTRFVQLSGLDDGCDTFEPVTVLGDEARIRQVATNLITNALQHTPEDARVVVRVGRVNGATPSDPPTAAVGAELTGDHVAAIEVTDTGPGMAATDARRAFERLFRADASRSRRHGGAGLGLSIVAAIVQAHGGRVELWTAPAAGSRFRVLLTALPPSDDEWAGQRFQAYSEQPSG